MDPGDLTERFTRARPRLHRLAYRMLGRREDAEDAVQEAWIRLQRTGDGGIDDLDRWLTTVVGRVCLDQLRRRRSRPEQAAGESLPEPVIGAEPDPAERATLADSLGFALMVVLDRLDPAERVAFVLHDVFAHPFADVAAVLGISEAAARQRASRARRTVRGLAPAADSDPRARWLAVEAFLTAARTGDLDALLRLLAPDVVLRTDVGRAAAPRPTLTGAPAVAESLLQRAPLFAHRAHPALVDGQPGLVVTGRAGVLGVLAFTVHGGVITALHLVVDPAKLTRVPGVRAATPPGRCT